MYTELLFCVPGEFLSYRAGSVQLGMVQTVFILHFYKAIPFQAMLLG